MTRTSVISEAVPVQPAEPAPRRARGFGTADSLLIEVLRRIGASVLAMCALIVFVFVMARLTGKSTAEVQQDRIATARAFATGHGVILVLKGERTLLAFPDGRVWINPTGTPAMGTGGSGDILTGLISGFLAQFPKSAEEAVAAAVYLHGLAGEIGARAVGEKSLIATDILKYLPDAISVAAVL